MIRVIAIDGIIDGLALLPAVAWLIAVIVRKRSGTAVGPLVRATVAAAILSFVLAHVNRWADLWPAHPNFPSGHETFASCMAVALAALDRRSLAFSAVLLAALGYALVRAGWHGRFEVVGGFLLGSAVMAASLKVSGAWPRSL